MSGSLKNRRIKDLGERLREPSYRRTPPRENLERTPIQDPFYTISLAGIFNKESILGAVGD